MTPRLSYRNLSTADAKSWLAQIRNAGAIGCAAASPEVGIKAAAEYRAGKDAETGASARRTAEFNAKWNVLDVIANSGVAPSTESAEESLTRNAKSQAKCDLVNAIYASSPTVVPKDTQRAAEYDAAFAKAAANPVWWLSDAGLNRVPVLREGGCTTEAEQLRAENARLKALTESLTGMVRSSADKITALEATIVDLCATVASLRASLEAPPPSPAPAPNPLMRAVQARPRGYGLASPEGM